MQSILFGDHLYVVHSQGHSVDRFVGRPSLCSPHCLKAIFSPFCFEAILTIIFCLEVIPISPFRLEAIFMQSILFRVHFHKPYIVGGYFKYRSFR